MQEKLFRKVSLERLSSPEQLDELMEVTSSRSWMALLAMGILVITAIFWSIFGSIPTNVTGQGILIKHGGALDIEAPSSGEITALEVSAGDIITKGGIIARIGQRELIAQIAAARDSLSKLNARQQQISLFDREDVKLQKENIAGQRKVLNYSIKVSEEYQKWLKDKIASQKKLLEQGLITKQALLSTEQEYYSTQEEIEKANNQLKQISVDDLKLKKQKAQELSSFQRQIDEAEKNIALLEDKLDMTSKVCSPYTGRVLEVMVNKGKFVNTGTPILNLELTGEEERDLEVIIYVPPADGKKVKDGMDAQISPSTVMKEKYGIMLGKVTSVSEFPSTYQGMMSVLDNDGLVRKFSDKEPPIAVHANLIRDNKTVSGYKWSSPKGPPIKVYSGTLCTATVTIGRQHPISLVIPLVKQYLGI